MSPRAITEHQFEGGNMTTGSTTACDGDASLTDNRNACVGGDMEAAVVQPTSGPVAPDESDRCDTPTARRFGVVCDCWACLSADRSRKRTARYRHAGGAHECPICGQRFHSLHGLRCHRGQRHKQETGVIW